MEAPEYHAPPIDPEFAAVKAQAQNDRITAIQTELGHDSASLLARFGRQQAVASATGAAPAAMPLYGMAALASGPR